MKTKIKTTGKDMQFDTVKNFRAIKEKISTDIADMNIEQLRAYLQERKVR